MSSSGGYSTSVPLDIPGARGGLPVPVSLVYGGGGVGAAGLGWDVPLSYIFVDQTIAHRRPMRTADGGWQNRIAVSLVLEGRGMELVRTGTDWVARHDAPDILVRQQADGTWVMFDGQGRTYSFTVVATPGNPAAAMWLLKSITGAGGSQVVLDYNITTQTVPSGGLAIDLATVSYNPHPTTANCFKNAVSLVYDADAASPLSLSVLGDRILARAHKLTAVNVKSKATCGDGYVRLRSYELTYQSDVDTQLPRLSTVRLFGRDGTTEAATAIPVATYRYGSASTGALQYTLAGQAASGLVKPNTKTDASALPGGGTGFSTFASLIDLSGDGLLDLIKYDASVQTLSMVRDWLHSTQSVSLGDGMPQTPLESRNMPQARYQIRVRAIQSGPGGRRSTSMGMAASIASMPRRRPGAGSST